MHTSRKINEACPKLSFVFSQSLNFQLDFYFESFEKFLNKKQQLQTQKDNNKLYLYMFMYLALSLSLCRCLYMSCYWKSLVDELYYVFGVHRKVYLPSLFSMLW